MNRDQVSLLHNAAQAFQRVCAGEDPLFNAIQGLRSTILACDPPSEMQSNAVQSSDPAVLALSELILAAAPQVEQACEPAMDYEAIYLGLFAAIGLLHDVLLSAAPPAEVTQARLHHTILLACELSALHCRRSIERSGDRLRRHIAYRRFDTIAPFGQTAH